MAPFRQALVLLTVAVVTVAALPLHAQKGQKGPSLPAGLVLPKSVKEALDHRFKGWQIATVDPQAASCRQGGGAPAFVQADFDSDDQTDLALALKVGNVVHLVAILERIDGEVIIVDVDSIGAASATGYLGVEKRGTKIPDSAKLDDYFTADTLTVYRCGQPPTAYWWSGMDFVKTILS